MPSLRRATGWILVIVAMASIVQSARELRLGTSAWRTVHGAFMEDRPFTFAGHTFTVADNLRDDATQGQRAFEGQVQVLMDGRPLGPPTRARVRPGQSTLGRYHEWFNAWRLDTRPGRGATLYLSRRIEPARGDSLRFEVTEFQDDGTHHTRMLRPWQLGTNDTLYRATQFVRQGEWEAFPLSMADAVIFPPILLLFPIGPLLVGCFLLCRARWAGLGDG